MDDWRRRVLLCFWFYMFNRNMMLQLCLLYYAYLHSVQARRCHNRNQSRKRKLKDAFGDDPVLQSFLDLMGKLSQQNKEVLEKFEASLSNPVNSYSIKRQNLYEALSRIPGLDETNKIRAGFKLAQSEAGLDLFYGFPTDEERAKYIRFILEQ